MGDATEHYVVSGYLTDDGVVAECACGWCSEPAASEADFRAVWREHVAMSAA